MTGSVHAEIGKTRLNVENVTKRDKDTHTHTQNAMEVLKTAHCGRCGTWN